jgi:hypothetical protein
MVKMWMWIEKKKTAPNRGGPKGIYIVDKMGNSARFGGRCGFDFSDTTDVWKTRIDSEGQWKPLETQYLYHFVAPNTSYPMVYVVTCPSSSFSSRNDLQINPTYPTCKPM